MASIFDMIERIESLDEVKEWKRQEAAEKLRKEIAAFVAHIGHSYTYECENTGLSYELMDDGAILAKDDSDNEQSIIELNLYLEEMELIREHLYDVLNAELLYDEDEIDRYTNLCL